MIMSNLTTNQMERNLTEDSVIEDILGKRKRTMTLR